MTSRNSQLLLPLLLLLPSSLRPPANKETRAFNKELNELSRSKGRGSAQKAEALLLSALEPGEENGVYPNVVSFSTVLNAWSRTYEAEAPDRALLLLERLERLYKETGNDGLRANAYTYGAVINTLGRSRVPDAASRAETILHKMEEFCEAGDVGCCPDSYIYSSCINAWTRSTGDESAERAHALLERMEEPDTIAYTSVIQAYARSNRRDAAEKAERLLKRMNELVADGSRGVAPNFRTINYVLQAFARKATFANMYAEKSEKLLSYMEEQYNAGYRELRPTTGSFNLCLKALANSAEPDAAQRASVLLNRMHVLHSSSGSAYVKADKISYGHAIRAWTKAGKGGPEKAARLLKTMLARYDAGDDDCRPSTYVYNMVLDGFANASRRTKGYGKKAENLLYAMEKRFQQGERDVKPSLVTYNIALKALSRSNEKWAAERADAILESNGRTFRSWGRRSTSRCNFVCIGHSSLCIVTQTGQ